jgi:transposase
MTRLYGRAPKGERVVGSVPQNYGQTVTVLAALGAQGLQAMMTGEGATEADVLRADVTHVLGPTLAPGDIVVLDNLRAHKAVGIQPMLARRRVHLRYVPPYSPALSAIEPCWSQVKTGWRTAQARTREALDTALSQALATVTTVDAYNWFRHCGYVLHGIANCYMISEYRPRTRPAGYIDNTDVTCIALARRPGSPHRPQERRFQRGLVVGSGVLCRCGVGREVFTWRLPGRVLPRKRDMGVHQKILSAQHRYRGPENARA